MTAEWMTQLVGVVQSVPAEIHAATVSAVLAGLALWCMGGRLLKPVFAILGVLAGASLGYAVPPLLGVTSVAGFPSPYVGAITGAVVGLALAMLLFKFAVAVAGAAVLGVAGLLISSATVTWQPSDADLDEPLDAAAMLLDGVPVRDDDPTEQPDNITDQDLDAESASEPAEPPPAWSQDDVVIAEPDPSAFAPGTEPRESPGRSAQPEDTDETEDERTRTDSGDDDTNREQADADEPVVDGTPPGERAALFIKAAGEELSARLEQVPASSTATVGIAGLVGAGLGVLLGILMPTKSAAAATALLGSALWLGNLGVLMQLIDAPGASLAASVPPIGALLTWIVAAAAGMAVQLKLVKTPLSDDD